DSNGLTFSVGAVREDKKGRLVMGPVLWTFLNNEDWKLNKEKGKYTHPFGPNPKTPDAKSVTHTWKVHYAGCDLDLKEMKEGDYILQVPSAYDTNPSVVPTVLVNGKPVGSFLKGRRQLVVSGLLKPGENEIVIKTAAVANQLERNDVLFELHGPVRYSNVR